MVAKQEALGHPAVWAVEQEKLIQSVRTAVAFDVEHSLQNADIRHYLSFRLMSLWEFR